MIEGAAIYIRCVCYDCLVKHEEAASPERWSSAASEWQRKHIGHDIEITSPKRVLGAGLTDREAIGARLGGFRDNANIKLAYAASASYTITLASLATSSTWVAGRSSASVSNGSNLYLDYLIGGVIKVGSTPTANTTLRLYAIGALDDSPTWPDVFDGTDAAKTVQNADTLANLPLMWDQNVPASANLVYPVEPRSLAACFGWIVPVAHQLFVSHNTAVNLNSSGSSLKYTAIYATSA